MYIRYIKKNVILYLFIGSTMMETKDTPSSIEKTMVGSIKLIVDDLEKDKGKESLVLNKKETKRSNVDFKVNIL